MNQSFQVQGMTCNHCVRAVTEAIKTADPQADVRVDLASGQVQVQSSQERAQLVTAIEAEGYTVAG